DQGDEIERAEKAAQREEEGQPAEQTDADDKSDGIDQPRLEPADKAEPGEDRPPGAGTGQREQRRRGETDGKGQRGSAEQGKDGTDIAGELREIGERRQR